MKVLDLLKLSTKYITAEEGFVITTNKTFFKIKHETYVQMHGLVTEGTRENLLIKTILDKNLDDVISQIPPGEKLDFIIAVEKIVNSRFNKMVVDFKELRRKFFQDFGEDRKKFALKHSKDEMFSPVMKTLNTSFRDVEQTAEGKVTEYILHVTRDLNKAKTWLNMTR